MEERLLKFARILEAGSFTKAAAVLHTSQPALTIAVKKLERELGTELLIRSSKGLRATQAGAEAYETAKRLEIEVKNLELSLRQQSNKRTRLRIGMIDSIAQLLFARSETFAALETHNELSITVDNSSRLRELVLHDTLDIALLAGLPGVNDVLTGKQLGNEPLVIVTSPDMTQPAHAALKAGRIPLFLSYNQQSRTQTLVFEALEKKNVVIEPVFYSTSPEIILQLVLRGKGTAALPYLLVEPYLRSRALQKLSFARTSPIERPIMAVWRKGKRLPPSVEQLTHDIARSLKELMKSAA